MMQVKTSFFNPFKKNFKISKILFDAINICHKSLTPNRGYIYHIKIF